MFDPNEDHRPFELFHCYRRGWKAGATTGHRDPKHTEHEDPEFVAEYERGYKEGRETNSDAMKAAAERIGYTPNVLRLAGGQ